MKIIQQEAINAADLRQDFDELMRAYKALLGANLVTAQKAATDFAEAATIAIGNISTALQQVMGANHAAR